ncbi:hypothetical protein LA080_000006 [Diaporthe eres]|nr:hypothetical protein LA080_000006 [Diaporthe eres]
MSFSKETLEQAPAGSVGILKLQTQQAAPDSFGFWILTSRRELVGVSILSSQSPMARPLAQASAPIPHTANTGECGVDSGGVQCGPTRTAPHLLHNVAAPSRTRFSRSRTGT